MTDTTTPGSIPLPLVVQLGFAGSRRLFDPTHHTDADQARLEADVTTWLAARLLQLRHDLGLEEHHFFCGISAIAIGADTVFCQACRANGIPLRIFLPQTRDEFLNAEGSEGPDFPSDAHKDQARNLLDSPGVIQERLVSDASIRNERFADVNREIVRVSDVLICLVREAAEGRAGGTEDLIARATQRDKIVLVIQVGVVDGKLRFTEQWRLPQTDGKSAASPAAAFNLPVVPRTLAGVRLSDPGGQHASALPIERYVTEVKKLSSEIAMNKHREFKRMAKVIVGTHIIATILAAIALALMPFRPDFIPPLLVLELAMLIAGFGVHHQLHKTSVSYFWAEGRLLAEVTRSVLAIGDLYVYLEYLFLLPFPPALRPLLRTINVLHLQSTCRDRTPWTQKRERYVSERLTKPPKGQIPFYSRNTREAKEMLHMLHTAFNGFWIAALVSTSTKLVLNLFFDKHVELEHWLGGIMGILAIVTPVLAVAALSLAAAWDLEAQENTYQDMLEFLHRQQRYLTSATSERDFTRLVLETESHLLGETATWFSRRSFTGVT